MLCFISLCSILFAVVQGQVGFPGPGNNCPKFEQCMQKAQTDQDTCGGCVQQDPQSGSLKWNPSGRNCASIGSKYRNLKQFLNCESAYQVKQRALNMQGCELDKTLSKCMGDQFGSQINCTDMFSFPTGGGTDPWNEASSTSTDSGSPNGWDNWNRKKRSSRNKRQVDTGIPFPGQMYVWTDACFYATNSSFNACEKEQCNTAQDGCLTTYTRDQDRLATQYKNSEKTFESCVKLFDRAYDRSYMYMDYGSPAPLGRRRRR